MNQTAAEPAALAEQTRSAPTAARRLRVLIIEDSRDAADSLQMLLDMFGHETRVAYTGTDGVAAAAEYRPDVVLSDIGLPGLDGYAVARALREHPVTAGVRLIAVTGYGGPDDCRRARASGFDHVLVKPADPAELLTLLDTP
jgi:CheY-like chemotaxis protein